jgi:Ni/Co efflux regulator RcnB
MGDRVAVGPFLYPRGWGYRRWVVGAILPSVFVIPGYFFADWAVLGLAAPPSGFQWVRYGPDLLLVDLSTSQVVDAVYGVFY